MSTRTRHRSIDAVAPAPRWAVVCAWLIPLTVLPSAIWRSIEGIHHIDDGGSYLLFLSVLSMGLGLLSVGLVNGWGSIYPQWIPLIGGRVVPARGVAVVAHLGASIIIGLSAYLAWNYNFGNLLSFTPLLGPGEVKPPPGMDIVQWYIPMAAWGPLLIAVAANYLRRHTRTENDVRCAPIGAPVALPHRRLDERGLDHLHGQSPTPHVHLERGVHIDVGAGVQQRQRDADLPGR